VLIENENGPDSGADKGADPAAIVVHLPRGKLRSPRPRPILARGRHACPSDWHIRKCCLI
jgi:hypothetical protein